MRRYKNILLGLELAGQDEAIIRYAGMISHMAHTEKIYFLHVAAALDLLGEIYTQYPELRDPPDRMIREHLEDTVRENFRGFSETETFCEVSEGKILDELLRAIRMKDIDLVIMGRGTPEDARGRLAKRIARKAPCPVLIIPEKSEARLNKVLVATDFSEYSAPAMEAGIAFASAAGIPEILCLHVYQVPLGYFKTGKNREEFAGIMLNNARENFQRFIRQFDLKGLNVREEYLLESDVAKAIREAAAREAIDLIIVGSRGKSASAVVLLGSVTENLVASSPIPLLDAKPKGAGIGLIDALLNP